MTTEPHYKRILLKLSGEALAGEKGGGFDFTVLERLAQEVKDVVDMGICVGLVIGGGTNYSAQIACIELPATAPNLAAYLNARPGPSTAPHTVVPAAAPARAQAPNAPRV